MGIFTCIQEQTFIYWKGHLTMAYLIEKNLQSNEDIISFKYSEIE